MEATANQEQPQVKQGKGHKTKQQVLPFGKKILKDFGWLDRFSTTPSFNYRGDAHYSFVGVLISLGIYIFLAWYLVSKLDGAFNDPDISSYSLIGQLEDELDFSEVVICMDDGVTNFASNVDINQIFFVSSHTGLTFTRNNNYGYYTGICGNFNGDASVNTNDNINIGVDHSKFSQNTITYRIVYLYIAFNETDISVPRISSPKSYTQNKGSLQSFQLNFEKAHYSINRSPLTRTREIYDSPAFSSIDQRSATSSLAFIQLRYTAKKTVYTIKYGSLPSIFSDIVGMRDTLTTFFVILFLRFFELKYYENLSNSFKPENKKLRVGFLPLLGINLGSIRCFKNWKSVSDKESVDQIKKEKELLDEKLEVTKYLASDMKEQDIELYSDVRSEEQSPNAPTPSGQ